MCFDEIREKNAWSILKYRRIKLEKYKILFGNVDGTKMIVHISNLNDLDILLSDMDIYVGKIIFRFNDEICWDQKMGDGRNALNIKKGVLENLGKLFLNMIQ